MKLTWYLTEAKNFRILVDGAVHPRLMSFTTTTSVDDIAERLKEVFPDRKIDIHVTLGNDLIFTVEDLPKVVPAKLLTDKFGNRSVTADMVRFTPRSTDVHVLEYMDEDAMYHIDRTTGLVAKFVGFNTESGYHHHATAVNAMVFKSKEDALAEKIPRNTIPLAYRKLRISYTDVT